MVAGALHEDLRLARYEPFAERHLLDAARREIAVLVVEAGCLGLPARLVLTEAGGRRRRGADERAVVVDAEVVAGRPERVAEVALRRRRALRPLPLQLVLRVGRLVVELDRRLRGHGGRAA